MLSHCCKCKWLFTFLILTAATHELYIIRLSTPVRRCSSGSSLGFARTGPSPPYGQGAITTNRRLSLGGARPFQLSPQGSSEAGLQYVNHFYECRSHPFSVLYIYLEWKLMNTAGSVTGSVVVGFIVMHLHEMLKRLTWVASNSTNKWIFPSQIINLNFF